MADASGPRGDDERRGMPNPTLSHLEKKSRIHKSALALFQSFIHDYVAAHTQQLY